MRPPPGAHSKVRAVQIRSMSINAAHGNDPHGPDQECQMGFAPLGTRSLWEDHKIMSTAE